MQLVLASRPGCVTGGHWPFGTSQDERRHPKVKPALPGLRAWVLRARRPGASLPTPPRNRGLAAVFSASLSSRKYRASRYYDTLCFLS